MKKTLKKIIAHFNFTLTIKLNGRKFHVPIIRNMGFLNLNIKDKWFMEIVEKLKLPNDADFIDVGVNVGQTLLAFRSVYNQAYWGFEPNPSCVFYLHALIEANHLKKTNIIPVGLGAKNELVKFYLKNESDSAGTIVKDLRIDYYDEEQINFVPVFSFENLQLNQIKKVAVIKIDVEGAELEVIKGMQDLISKNHPAIVCEILDCHSVKSIEPMQTRANELIHLLKGLGYLIYRINHQGKQVELQSIEEIKLKLWDENSFNLNDYLFLPKENRI